MMIDLSSRKITPVPSDVLECVDPSDIPVLGQNPFAKLHFPDGELQSFEPLAFRAQKSHIDLNGHVNNVHYVEWMLEPCRQMHPKEIDITFKSEALAGDEVLVAVFSSGDECFHRVSSASGKDHVLARTSGAVGV